ncbi:MAG: uroporphyrin-III C-methyltransferase/precorrin-2 dehydrogenase/sirohydrochlorin ferrochelatase [Paracoccaceae bacterium]|jgi:uroporphyrin-III C-methyltransferase/precorrin-2 dehydrogenase/sirohydrochlorin ferrochelatase
MARTLSPTGPLALLRRAVARVAPWSAADILRLARRVAAPPQKGMVSLVGAGPGSADLITLRGARRIEAAEVILYDRLIDMRLLDLASPSAALVHVGKDPNGPAWKQARIDALLVDLAKAGKRVVRLKCGDPGVFARGAEEAAALSAAGEAWEIVPGVTAASAASAAAGGFLTERGALDTLVLATGHVAEGAPAPDWAGHLRPGATLALYMGVRNAPAIQAALLGAGHSPDLPVDVVAEAETPRQQVLRTSLGRMAADIASAGIRNPALILIKRRKSPAPVLAATVPAQAVSG